MNNSISNNILWRFAERFLAQLIAFIVSIILARILLPEHYGTVALVNVFILFADVFVESGLPSALIQKKDSDNFDFSTVFYFNIGFSIILYVVLFFLAPIISDYYNNYLLTPVIRVLSIRIFIAAFNSIQQAYISKNMQFKKFFLATLFGTIVSAAVGIILAYNGFGVWALVFQYLSNILIDTIILFFVIKWKPLLYFSLRRLKYLLKYGWKILFEGVAATFYSQIRNLIIGKVYTEIDLGYYNRGDQFPGLIMNNINTSINSVLFPAMSKVQEDNNQLVTILRKSIRITSYILFPMLFGMAAIAFNMVIVLLTDKWIDCVPFIYIACFIQFITIGMYPRHQALKAIGRSDIFMIEHMMSRVIGIILLILVYRISVLHIALTGVVSTIILFIIIVTTSKKYSNYKIKDQISDVLVLVLMSLIMFLPTFLFGYFVNINPILELLIQIIMGITIYFILSIILKPEGFVFIIGFIRRLFFCQKEVN